MHKANIMKLGDGMFLKACREMAAKYPQGECCRRMLPVVVAGEFRGVGCFISEMVA